MDKIITSYVSDKASNVLLTAAEKNGWKINVVNKEKSLSYISKNNLTYQICSTVISANPLSAGEISQDKYLTNQVLSQITNLIPDSKEYKISEITDNEIKDLLNKHEILVVKPVDKNNGVGVFTSLKTREEIRNALNKLIQLGCEKCIIENHVKTINEFRIITWKGKIVEIIKRTPANVIGDDEKTVIELIEEKNNLLSKTFGDFWHKITIDSELEELLAQNNLNLQSIPEKDELIYLRLQCNMMQGGEVERVSSENIHEDYINLFREIYKSTWLTYCGIDLIAPNLHEKPDPKSSVVNELNGSPGISMRFLADIKEERLFFGVTELLKQMEEYPVDSHLSSPDA